MLMTLTSFNIIKYHLDDIKIFIT